MIGLNTHSFNVIMFYIIGYHSPSPSKFDISYYPNLLYFTVIHVGILRIVGEFQGIKRKHGERKWDRERDIDKQIDRQKRDTDIYMYI